MQAETKKMAALLNPVAATETSPHHNAGLVKWQRVLCRLIDSSLNRFEAEGLHDHCLNSTIPKIEERGVRVAREWERVPCRGGKDVVRVLRYRVERTAENLQRARALLKATA